ncbi:MAG: ABC transporter permease [Candidatus Sericytochromatia bacterium]|nr:ABC transporter permease [Candidatus Sericytochromatia bacterium]
MGAYLIKRLLLMPITLLGVFTLTFALLFLIPGDPVSSLVGQHADPQTVAAIREQLGLDKSVPVQYVERLWHTLQGDWGRSFVRQTPVLPEILERLPATAELAAAAIFVQVLVGVSIGLISAIRPRSWIDRTLMVAAIGGVSMPSFLVGLVAIYVFGTQLRWLPVGGYSPYFPDNLVYLIMPAIALGMRGVAIVARLTRSALLEVVRQDYIRTARAKGLSQFTVMVRHALRNAMIPIMTFVGMDVGYLLGGAVVTEIVFTWPGFGMLAVQALPNRAIPVVLGTVLFASFFVVVANLLTDLGYSLVGPRIKVQS